MKKDFLIIAEYGIHARPATRLVNEAMKQSDKTKIYMESLGRKINLKSIMGLMSLGIYKGETVTIIAEGDNEELALNNIKEFLLKEGLGKEI